MPFYELNLVIRPTPRQELIDCLKKTASLLWREDAVIKRIEFLGFKKLPYNVRSENADVIYSEGNYFIYHISSPFNKMKVVRPELVLDRDILRFNFFNRNESVVPDDYECTLEEELLPPVHRPSVQALISDKNVRTVPRRVHNIRNEKVKLIG